MLSFSRTFRARIVTTDWVLMEVADALAASDCRVQIRDIFSYLRGWPVCEVIPADREILDRGLEVYHRHRDKKWTLTDCTSFVLMKERGLTEALTADHHFEQAVFLALLK